MPISVIIALALCAAVLILLDLLALRYGVDSRELDKEGLLPASARPQI